jgi:hypothetical protein
MMKIKLLYGTLLAFTFLLLISCTPSTQIKIPEVSSFFKDVMQNTDSISKARLEKLGDVYLVVNYSLKTDDFPPQTREAVFAKTRDFFADPKIKNLVVQQLGKNGNRIFNEGFSIRFQNPTTSTYWVYRLQDNNWSLVE